ncbi:MAG: DUF87 domain-containing protein, partial [Crenarchaeota archaeon]|nr:DUF87 domain-containing protein [Thermoproteota archaeon]
EPPRPMSVVAEPPPGLLQGLLRPRHGAGLYMGSLAYNPSVGVLLDPRRLDTHLAVIGQTGSGKSETVKRLVAEYAWWKPAFSRGGGVVVLDVSGEYTGHPYQPPSGVTLLDAVLRPRRLCPSMAAVLSRGMWLSKAPKTILVPYDLSTISLSGSADRAYAKTVADFAKAIAGRYPGTRVEVLVYGRHNIYHAAPGGQPRPVGRDDAARLLRSRDALLVVAAPLPDALTVEEVYALSGTRSEQLPQALTELADRLGVLDVEGILTVSGLNAIVDILSRLQRQKKLSSPDQLANAAERLVSDLALAAAGGTGSPEQAIEKIIEGHVDIGFVPTKALHNLLLLPHLVEQPDAPRDAAATHSALSTRWPDLSKRWEDTLRLGARLASLELGGLHPGTRASLARALKKVGRMVSPLLDAGQYRLLAERVYEGFTIVHLAHPSLGGTSIHVAKLLDELYRIASTGYQPGQQTLIVVEEAHNHAPAGEETPSGRALLRIAREGRKYGLSLVLVTQRPGFVDQNVLSQAASLIALRVTNPDDLAALRRSVESTSEEMVEKLPDLEPGQALISGPILPERRIPVLARIAQLT